MSTVTLYRPRGAKVWYAKWLQPNGKYRKKSLKTEDSDLARKIKSEIENQVQRERYGIQVERDYLPEDAFNEYLRLVDKSPRSIDQSKLAWTRFFDFCKAPTIRSVRRADVTAWVKSMQKSMKPSTIDLNCSLVSTVYSTLRQQEVYDGNNPFTGRAKVNTGTRKIRTIEWAVIERMLEETKGTDVYFIVLLGGLLGLRRGEICDARWEHINWHSETIEVQGTKTTGSKATLHLHPALRQYLEPYKRDSGYICMPSVEHTPGLYRCDLRPQWERARVKYGVSTARMHDLRHTFATRLLALGYPMISISKMLRHTSTRTTEIYADLRTITVKLGDIR